MLTKGAIGNLVNRYRAVLTKCNLINTFGSLAVASMLVLGGAGVAEANVPLYDADMDGRQTAINKDHIPTEPINWDIQCEKDRVYAVFNDSGTLTLNESAIFNITATGNQQIRAIRADKGENLLFKKDISINATADNPSDLTGVNSWHENPSKTSEINFNGNLSMNLTTNTGYAHGFDLRTGKSKLNIKGTTNVIITINGNGGNSIHGYIANGNTASFEDDVTFILKHKGNPGGDGWLSPDEFVADVRGLALQGNTTANFDKALKINIENTQANGIGIYSSDTNSIVKVNGSNIDIDVISEYGSVWGISALRTGEVETSDNTFTDIYVKGVEATGISVSETKDDWGKYGSGYASFGGKVTISAIGTDTAYGVKATDYASTESVSYSRTDGNAATVIFNDTLNSTVSASNGDAYALYAREGKITVEGDASLTATAPNGDAYAIKAIENSTVTLNGNSTLNGDVFVDDTSTLTLGSETSLAGDATIEGTLEGDNIAIELANGDASLTVADNQANITSVSGTGAANDAVGGDVEALLSKVKDAEGNCLVDKSKFTGMDEGLISGKVNADGTQEANTILVDTLDIATAAPLAVSRIVINDVRKRMGDLRDSKEDAGAWVRWEGGKLKGDSGLTNDFNTIQVGADMLTGIKNVRAGVAAAFTHGDLDHFNGDGEMETYSFSAYGTWMADNGMFADVIARVGFTNTEVTVKGMTADLDNEVLSLSGEYGWRLPICDQFFVEPQVELTYTYITSADYKLDYASYSIDSVDSLIGRAGAVFGWKLPNDRGNLYARASVVHEFLNDAEINASAFGRTESHSVNGEDTWLEYGIGANVKLTDNTYVWADVERTEGAEIEEEWRGTVGFRFSF